MRLRNRKALVVIYTVALVTGMTAIASLAVDFGRWQLARSQIQIAADAAARYAVTGISDGTYVVKAQYAAQQNLVDGSGLLLLSSDVELGTWNSTNSTFTLGAPSPNAIRITGVRRSARGNAVPLTLASTLGLVSCNVSASAIGQIQSSNSTANPDVVGLSTVVVSGSSKIRRWSSESGTVKVGSNGSFSLSWGQQIVGDALYRGSPPSTPAGANCITGSLTPMPNDLAYVAPTTPGGSIPLGAVNYGNGGTYTVGTGNYAATSLTLGGGATVNVTGDVNLYASGAVNIGNGVVVNTTGTSHILSIYVTNSSQVDFNVSSNVYCRIYAPLSTVNLTGSTPFIGSVVAKNLNVSGSAMLNFSSDLPIPAVNGNSTTTAGGTISIVK